MIEVPDLDKALAWAAKAPCVHDALPDANVVNYQPYWVTRARLAELRGDAPAMRQALERALGLTEDAALRQFLSARLERCAP